LTGLFKFDKKPKFEHFACITTYVISNFEAIFKITTVAGMLALQTA